MLECPLMKRLRVEFHCHTSASSDSLVNPADLIRTCQEKGIDRVVITDHNVISGALAAKKIAPEMVIVGEEIKTTEGELLCAYVQEKIPKGLPPLEALSRLKAQGAFISVSHPFDASRKPWFKEGLDLIKSEIDAIEIFNARSMPRSTNEKARRYAADNSLAGTVGSDAHTLRELGAATMLVPEFNGADELKEAVLEAKYELSHTGPWARLASRYAAIRNNTRKN